MRLGVVASSGGATFRAMLELLDAAGHSCDPIVVTDRACGIERCCAERGLWWRRVESDDNAVLSRAARTCFEEQGGVEAVLLFITRLVTEELFAALATFNLHPSLLPAFPGLGALRRARESGARHFGATLHLVEEHPDGGPIVAQVRAPLAPSLTLEEMRRRSFLHKVYLGLVLVELHQAGAITADPRRGSVHLAADLPSTSGCRPALRTEPLAEAFAALQAREGVRALDDFRAPAPPSRA